MASEVLLTLQSDKSIKRLEQISSLRARGFSKDIDLPQLVVCGDQSAGKSSVLEGITQIPFPRAEGLCTKFPTEVILERSDGTEAIIATIIPHPSRSDESKSRLQEFQRVIKDFTQLPDVIATVGQVMGLRGYGPEQGFAKDSEKPAFVEDVLRIKVTGQTGPNLTIVDLPGLISVASDEQTEEDIATVQRMVDSYVEKPRTIILAVVQATNDIANQSIIKKSKKFDAAGQRTVGIITKPDLINEGTEGRIATLAKNRDTTKLSRGFFLLKNPTPMEMQNGITSKQRAENEFRYFNSSPWKEQKLDPSSEGTGVGLAIVKRIAERHGGKAWVEDSGLGGATFAVTLPAGS